MKQLSCSANGIHNCFLTKYKNGHPFIPFKNSKGEISITGEASSVQGSTASNYRYENMGYKVTNLLETSIRNFYADKIIQNELIFWKISSETAYFTNRNKFSLQKKIKALITRKFHSILFPGRKSYWW